MIKFPYTTAALAITQPIGTFYVASLPAELLLQVAASDRISAKLNPDGRGYALEGTQRLIQDKRLVQIGDYIDRVDAAFPNSIILAANFDRASGFDVEEINAIEKEERDAVDPEMDGAEDMDGAEEGVVATAWTVEPVAGSECFTLTIPSSAQLAAIIDGQHRLFAFAKAENPERLDMCLLCAIYIDLPKSLQAQIFATINSTQKPVDRSLTFELFGYNVAEEPEELWTPDKLAVFLTRKLGTENESPLYRRISVSPKRDAALEAIAEQADWKVSTAVVVDGIMRLISSNPKRDANAMRTWLSAERSEPLQRDVLRKGPADRSPLRDVYIGQNDKIIYKLVENYLKACDTLFWATAKPGSYIKKTVGVQALFDVLRKLAPIAFDKKDLRVAYFEEMLKAAAATDFSTPQFQSPSGSGRSIIRRAIEEKLPL